MASFVAPVSSSTPRKTLEPGNYIGRCYQMIALGTHEEEYLGTKKTVFKIWLGWEFPTEMEVFNEEKGEEPHTMGKEYSFYMNDKANFRKDLESWRGKKFTDDEARTFDAARLLGAPCLLNVVSYAKQSGEPGLKIGSISPVAKGMTAPGQILKNQAMSFDDFDTLLFESLPKFLKEKIQKSPEYKAMFNAEPVYQPQSATLSSPANAMPLGSLEPVDTSDDLPF